MIVAALVLVLLYAACGLIAARAARRPYPFASRSHGASRPPVTVIVAARDEEDHLPDCLHALLDQSYPKALLEVIVVNDDSRDDTAAIADHFAERHAHVRALHLSEAAPGTVLRGKARALHRAVEASGGDVIVVTDADCTPPAAWVEELVSAFAEPRTGVVCGVTLVQGSSLTAHIQALDWLLLLTVAAAAAALGYPVTAMGNNMAFRRRAYDDVGGYPGLAAGVTEDYALFRAVRRHPDWDVHLVLDPRLASHTAPLPSLTDAFRQRRRWARGGLRADAPVYALYGLVFAVHAALIAALFTVPFPVAVGLFAAKAGTDLAVLRAGRRRMAPGRRLRGFVAFEAFYGVYVLALPFSLALAPSIRWRGRVF